jgi:hypothetical protein
MIGVSYNTEAVTHTHTHILSLSPSLSRSPSLSLSLLMGVELITAVTKLFISMHIYERNASHKPNTSRKKIIMLSVSLAFDS